MNIELNDQEKIKVLCSEDLYSIMQQVLLREQKIDQDREHFWAVSLDSVLRILNIELISLGSVSGTLVEPMEVFSVPLQKRSVKLMLVHNHPSGELEPSEADKDLTDRLIQVGRIVNVPVLDHLIISTTSYYSFADTGLLEELEQSLKYVPSYRIKEMFEEKARKAGEKEGSKAKAEEMARSMKREGLSEDLIVKVSGLSKTAIRNLKI